MNTIGFLVLGCFAFTASVNAALNPMPSNWYYMVNHTISDNNLRIGLNEIKVNLTENRINHFIEYIRHNNYIVERTLADYTTELTLIGFLNQSSQNCVVKYASIPDIASLKFQINDCANKALYALDSPFYQAKSYIASSKSYNTYSIRNSAQSCYTSNVNNLKNMGACISNVLNSNNQLIDFNLNRIDKEIQRVLFLFDTTSRDASECIYNIELDLGRTIRKNKETIRLCQENLI